MSILLVFLSVVVVLIGIGAFFSKGKSKEDQILDESLKDETLYDPLTGKKITLEEAERLSEEEIKVDKYLIVSPADLQKYYSDEEISVEMVKNYFLEKGYAPVPEDLEFKLTEKFAALNILVKDISSIKYAFEVSPDHYILVVEVQHLTHEQASFHVHQEFSLTALFFNPSEKPVNWPYTEAEEEENNIFLVKNENDSLLAICSGKPVTVEFGKEMEKLLKSL
jgi:hypothetical protein